MPSPLTFTRYVLEISAIQRNSRQIQPRPKENVGTLAVELVPHRLPPAGKHVGVPCVGDSQTRGPGGAGPRVEVVAVALGADEYSGIRIIINNAAVHMICVENG